MEEDLIIKKIYINDYIINTTLLQDSISKLLVNTLSNKFYKTNRIQKKVNNILTKIDNIFIEDSSGNKIFNLAYQPYNQYNITHNYTNHNFNKKWIIPISISKKTLNSNILKIQFADYYNTTDLILETEDDIIKYNDSVFDVYSDENHFEDMNSILYKNQQVNLLGEVEKIEYPYLSTKTIYDISDPNNIVTTRSSVKTIRKTKEKTYYINSDNSTETIGQKNIKKLNKTIEEANYEVYNILENDTINIEQFLILNPLKLLHTNYNISIGNSISYLNEIMSVTYLNIDNIINNYTNDLNTITFNQDSTIIDYNIVDKNEISNQYNNKTNFIYDYLNIIKNLNKFDNIYSIRILKHIYNIFGYDLDKVPDCYIVYLQDILHSNINKYINNNTNLLIYLLDKFKSYKSQKDNIINTDISYISQLYDISNITYNNNDPIFTVLYNNTHDKGLLYYLELYNKNYLKSASANSYKLVDEVKMENIKCSYRIVKKYNTMEEFTNDTLRFVDLEFSKNNYLIEYNDLVYNLQQDSSINYKFNNKTYVKNDDDKIKETVIENILPFIENKLYIYELLFEKLDVNTNILFSKLMLLKHKNKRYVQIPYKKLENDNLVLIEDKYYRFNSNDLELLDIDHETLLKDISNKCIYPSNLIKNNNTNLNKFFTKLNSIDLPEHKKNLLDLIEILKTDNTFKNFLLRKSKSYTETNIYFKNIEKISYPINYYNNEQLIDYLLKYNIKSIKQANLNEEQILNEISNSIFNTTYINQIKEVSIKIDQSQHKNLWNYIHHYVNEYELLTNVIEDGDKYNRAYYKLYELLLNNTIIDKPDFKLISLAEAPGNFVKCVQNLKNNTWNDYIICTLLDDTDTTSQGNFFTTYKDYIFGNINGKLKITDDANKDFKGDLTNPKDITIFVDYIVTNNLQADLITADGGIKKNKNIDYLLEEYNHLPLFLGEIVSALFTQKIGGTFILKMYDIVYINSVHLIHLLSGFYKKVEIVKPYNSRPCNTEKYIICSDFIGFNITKSNQDKIFSNLLNIISNLDSRGDKYKYFNIFDRLPNIEDNNNKIIEFNNSIIVKTQLLHLQDIYDIIMKNDKKQINLIKTYFGPKRNYNLKSILSSEENADKGYFIKKIESCITLALYMKLKNQPLKKEYIEYYKLIKNMKKSVENTNIYPPHFKEIYEINKEENKSLQVDKINKFTKKYCITFTKPGQHKILDYYILRSVEHFLLNSDIEKINHNVINKLRQNKTDLNKLHKYLEELCKITDIKKIFYNVSSTVISLIKNLQNTMRNYLGYYLCKYTYIPIYPKYKVLENVIDQVEQYGILYNSHYMCYYSGDKFDMEEFDDFMGDTVFRSNLSLFEEQSSSSNIIENISTSYNNNLSVEQNICSYILNKFKFDNTLKLNILNKLQYNTTSVLDEILNNINENYSIFTYLLNKKYDKSLIKTDKTTNTYVHNKNKYLYFKLEAKDLGSDVKNNSKIQEILNLLNTNKDLIIKSVSLNDKHLLIKVILDILLSKYFYDKYANTILYTLVQIVNNTSFNYSNIYDTYTKFEKNLIETTYKNSNTFDIFKNKILTNYLQDIKLPDFSTEKTMNDILELNNTDINELLGNYIKLEKDNWNPYKWWKSLETKNKTKYQENMTKLQSSKTVLDFLINIPVIDNRRTEINLMHLLKTNKITANDFSKLKLTLTSYLDKTEFTELCELINEDISNNHLFNSVNNIENNIFDNRVELSNKLLLKYEHNLSILKPDYLASPPVIYNSEEIYIFNCIKYLLLYVYEDDFTTYLGRKRLFDNNICLYTNNSKKNILLSINSLSNDEIKIIYKKIFNINKHIINKNNFVNKNLLINNDYTSLIYNTVYKINNNYIDILHKLINLFYNTIEETITEEQNDIIKNIIMRFYNDPISNIMTFLDNYKNDFISFVQNNSSYNKPQVIISLIEETYNNKDTYLFNIINSLNNTNLRSITSNIIAEIRKNSEVLKKFDIVIPYEDIVIKDLILIINNLKKNISFISNLADLNIVSDLKSKYNNIKKYYSSYEYNTLIDIIKQKNYNFNLSDFTDDDYDYLQVIYSNIQDDFNYNLNNIYSYNENITKYVLLLKLHLILINSLTKLDNTEYEFTIEQNLKYKFYLHQGKIQQNKEESALFTTEILRNSNKKYLNLFKNIVNDVIKNVNDYSSVINRLNPIKYSNDDTLTYDINDFNDITDTYDDGLMGDIEEMD